MSSDALTSHHVNYLIWRYLQEAGYGDAARRLSRDWNKNPEDLSFAADIKSHALVNIIQDGLWLDRLQSSDTPSIQRYSFGSDVVGERSTDGVSAAVGAAANRNGSEAVARDGLTTRRRHGPDEVPVVDQHAEPVDAEVGVPDKATPGPERPPATDHAAQLHTQPQSTLAAGKSTGVQSDRIIDLGGQAVVVNVGASVEGFVHASWSPSYAHVLLTANGSYLRLFSLPLPLPTTLSSSPSSPASPAPAMSRQDKQKQLESDMVSHRLSADPIIVTALTWTNDRDVMVACLVDLQDDDDGYGEHDSAGAAPTTEIICLGSESRLVASLSEMVFALKWNSEARKVLAISNNGVQGTVWLLDAAAAAAAAESSSVVSLAVDKLVLDGVWVSRAVFVICGHGILQLLDTSTADAIGVTGAIPTDVRWEMLKFEPASQTLVCASVEDNCLAVMRWPDDGRGLPALRSVEPGDRSITAVELFRPALRSRDGDQEMADTPLCWMAAAFDSGCVRIWDVSGASVDLIRQLRIDEPVMCLALSPDAGRLAAAGYNTVCLWSVSASRAVDNGQLLHSRPHSHSHSHSHSQYQSQSQTQPHHPHPEPASASVAAAADDVHTPAANGAVDVSAADAIKVSAAGAVDGSAVDVSAAGAGLSNVNGSASNGNGSARPDSSPPLHHNISTRPQAIWRRPAHAKAKEKGAITGDEDLSEAHQTISWSVDGRTLAFKHLNQVAIIGIDF